MTTWKVRRFDRGSDNDLTYSVDAAGGFKERQ